MNARILKLAALTAVLAGTAAGLAAARADRPAEAFHLVGLQVFTSGNIDTTLGTGTFTVLPAPVFTYTKKSATSVLKITYQDAVGNRGPGATTCAYQLRVDGNPGEGGPWGTPILVASNVVNTTLSSTGVFRRLSAGPHRITIWQRQVAATECIRNSGGFTTSVIVEEIEIP